MFSIRKDIKCTCNNCYSCLSNEELEIAFEETMNRSITSRLFACKCFMCNDDRSTNCYQLSLLPDGVSVLDFKNILITIENRRKKVRRRVLAIYLWSLYRFSKLLEKSNEKRYMIGGSGFREALDEFKSCISTK